MNIPYLSLKRVNERYADEVQHAVRSVAESGWFLQGRCVGCFEKEYADYIGTKHCISCGNGLDALRLMMCGYIQLGVLHEGDEVIVPANTYIATILAISECRLVPILVEPNPETLQIDDQLIERNISPRTKAIMVVHLYGRCAMTALIGELCHRHGLLLLEDNAQAHGCTFQGKRTGALGAAAAHSFYPTKNLGAMGDAGAVTTDDDRLAAVVRALGNYGSKEKYVFDYQGFNSRMDEMQAAVLSVKLRWLDRENACRKQIARHYLDHVRNQQISMLPDDGVDNVFHIFPVLCQRREQLQRFLMANGVETQIHYPIPPHQQRCYALWNNRSLPVSERIHQQELSIPCNPTMTKEEVDTVVNLLNNF